MKETEDQYPEAPLKAHDGNVRATARALGIARDTLYRKIKKYNPRPKNEP